MVFERLRAELTLDHSSFKSNLQDSQNELSSFGDRAASLGSSLQKTGAAMTAGISGPLSAIGVASLRTASQVEEMESKFNEVFQSSADNVAEWADTHADEIGRSQNQLQEYAAGFGSLLDAMGASTDETAEMSKELTSLTADLASFENMSEQQVQSKLESALAGQSRAVREFGVDLSAAREEQILMNEGLAESREEATQAELAQARLIAIQEDTATAAGDAARTSESYANQVRALKANVEDMRAEIGQHLLPVATTLVQRVQGLTGAFGNLSHSQQQFVIGIGATLAILGPVAAIFGTLLTLLPAMQAGWATFVGFQYASAIPAAAATVAAYAPIIATVGAVAVAIGALWKAWDSNLGNIQGRTQSAVSSIIGFLEPYLSILKDDFIQTFQVWRQAGEDVLGWFEARWSEHRDTVISIVDPYLSFLQMQFELAFETIQFVVESGMDVLVSIVRAGLAVLRGDFSGALEVLNDLLDRQVDRFGDYGRSMMETLAEGIRDMASAPVDAVEDAVDNVRDRLPSSPAKEGPLSDIDKAGEALIETPAEAAEKNSDRLAEPMNELPGYGGKPRVGGESGSGGQGKVIKELRAVRNALEGMSVRIETGDETLDRVIREEAEVVIDQRETQHYNDYTA